MSTITLEWTEFTNSSTLPDNNNTTEYGVYIWGFCIKNEFIPYYVGIADNIIFRIYQHLNSLIGGLYTIYHKDSLVNFKEFKKQDVNQDKSFGKIYSPNWPKEYKSFITERKTLQKHIDFMVDSFSFSYATVDKSIIKKIELQEIEKICINQIGKENLQNTRSGDSSGFEIEHLGNKTIKEMIEKSNKPLTMAHTAYRN